MGAFSSGANAKIQTLKFACCLISIGVLTRMDPDGSITAKYYLVHGEVAP